MSDKEWDTCKACVDKVNSDQNIQNALHPKDDFKYDLPSFNEDAIFLDVIVTYKDKFKILKLKMKADNWTIDEENKVLTLNDLKTTSKPVHWFMNSDYGSFYKYHYYRQFAMYLMMLEQYCIKEYGYNKDWQSKCNVLVVGTVDCDSKLYRVNKNQLVFGKMEYENLLKRVAYYELFGYTKEVEFID